MPKIDIDNIDDWVKTRVVDSEDDIMMLKERANVLHARKRIQAGFYPNFDAQPEKPQFGDDGFDHIDPPPSPEGDTLKLSELNKADLVALANEEGIDESGNKAELLARLTEALV